MGAELVLPDSALPADLSKLSRDQLVELGRKAAFARELTQWMLGDLACEVETSYGESELAKFAAEIGVEWSTLRGYAQVSRAFPQSVPRGTHSWTVYRELAAQEDRLELVSGEHMTVQEARELVRERRRKKFDREHRRALRERRKAREEAAARKAVKGKTGAGDDSPSSSQAGSPASPEGKADSGTVQEPMVTVTELTAAEPDPAPQTCLGCRSKDELIRDLQAQLGQALERIGQLTCSAGPDGADQDDPGTHPQESPEAADAAGADGQEPSGAACEVTVDGGSCGAPGRWYWVREAAHHQPRRRAICPGHLEKVRQKFIVEDTMVQAQALGGYVQVSADEVDQVYEVPA